MSKFAALPEVIDDDAPPPYEANPRVVLWVDDRPQNNADLIRMAESENINVIIATTTAKACEIIDRGVDGWNFRVITDMHRVEENGVSVAHAGLRLMEELLSRRMAVYPILLYTGTRKNVQVWEEKYTNFKGTIEYDVAKNFVLYKI